MKWIALTLYFSLFNLSLEEEKHAFHASITLVEFNQNSQNLQVTSKLFTDDLERALENATGKKIRLENGADTYKAAIQDYITKHFKISKCFVDPTTIFVGYETEFDLTYVYLEISGKNSRPVFDIKNTTFFELYDDQSNIVTVHWKDQRKSAFLSPNKPNETIEFAQHE